MEDRVLISAEDFKAADTKTSFRDIVIKQIQRITDIYSRELVQGYLKKTQPSQYGSQEIVAYIPDGRISYIQAVECLHDILLSKFDEEMKKQAKEICKAEEERLKIRNADKTLDKKKSWVKERVKFARQMFQQLCLMLDRLGWLEIGKVEE